MASSCRGDGQASVIKVPGHPGVRLESQMGSRVGVVLQCPSLLFLIEAEKLAA